MSTQTDDCEVMPLESKPELTQAYLTKDRPRNKRKGFQHEMSKTLEVLGDDLVGERSWDRVFKGVEK